MHVDIKQETDRLTMRLASRAGDVTDAISDLRAFLDEEERKDDSGLVLVFRELVNNAVEHGNKKVKELPVDVEVLRLSPGRFRLSVEDRGAGFDFRSADLSLPDDPTQIRNRGLALANSFADELMFHEPGNKVTAWISLPRPSFFHVGDEGEWRVLKPGGAVTAETADDFRDLFADLVEDGRIKYRFDLSDVSEIDSIGVSLFVVFANVARQMSTEAELEIVNASREIAKLFHMIRLTRVYRVRERNGPAVEAV